MKKYLNKEYLSKLPVIFFFILTLSSILGVYDFSVLHPDADDLGWTITLWIAYLNWFIMWNFYENIRVDYVKGLDDHMDTLKTAILANDILIDIAKELGFDTNTQSVTAKLVIDRIKELQSTSTSSNSSK